MYVERVFEETERYKLADMRENKIKSIGIMSHVCTRAKGDFE